MLLRRFLLLSTLPALAFIAGCGSDMPSTVPVTGTVTMDGSPVEGATVNFLSEEGARTASGRTDASGKFTLKTIVGTDSADGAVVGRHQVAVVKTESEGQSVGDPKEFMSKMAENPTITSDFKIKQVIPAKYGNPTMSGLTADVSEGGANDFTFELKSK